MVYHRGVGPGFFKETERMSKTLQLITIDGIDKPIDIVALLAADNATVGEMVCCQELVVLHWEGMFWLIPHEVMKECHASSHNYAKIKDSLNVLPPITITLQQCIPIPGETAKILLEL